ncbi:uncharacterized protein LOC125501652 [Athalia rosae]|uniref:uncharacterized protein LOC125501652 n=1 Tax=Athalia rosae TaxID=37344 RepID=UPI00203493BC|nr:uncharacterized protein LOC125501652 [Athalia rosae]
MRVNKAKNMFCKNVSASLELLAHVKDEESYQTTAWFVEKISQWFALMTSRHPVLALSKCKIDKYNEAIQILNEIRDIFRDIQKGHKNVWKPLQTGILISTTSISQLAEYYLEKKGLPFLLTGRFTQDCVENLFSIVRSKQPVPNALQF